MFTTGRQVRSKVPGNSAALAGPVRYLLFDDDGHQITRRENHAVLASTVVERVRAAFGSDV